MSAIWLCCASLAIPAVYFDLKERRIPNALILVFLLLSPLAVLMVFGFSALGPHLIASALVFLAGLVLWLLRWLGAGDVKLLSIMALLLGLDYTGDLLINTALAGAVLSLSVALYQGTLQRSAMRLVAMFSTRSHVVGADADLRGFASSSERLPYAVAIAAGTAMTLAGVSFLSAR